MTKLKSTLMAIGLKPTELASLMGVSDSAISRAVRGERCGAGLAFEISAFVKKRGGELSVEDVLTDVRESAPSVEGAAA